MKNTTIHIRTTEETKKRLNDIVELYYENEGTKVSQADVIERLIFKFWKESCNNVQQRIKIK